MGALHFTLKVVGNSILRVGGVGPWDRRQIPDVASLEVHVAALEVAGSLLELERDEACGEEVQRVGSQVRIGWQLPCYREGANREKLTVKKIINNEMFFFHRLCPL